jgi:tripartite-type tricarboxylate transporter receptor subunit TctC
MIPFLRLLVATLGCAASLAAAQTFPDKPIRVVVPYPAGGGIDLIARALGAELNKRWGHGFTVENKPGGSTIPAAADVARAAPDGYTLLLTTDSTMSVNPHLFSRLPYDPAKDFAPVTHLINLHQLLLAHPSVPANNLKELVDLARQKPSTMNYASYGNGSQPHLAMETFKQQAGIDIVHIPYKGIPQAVPAAIAGEVQFTFSGAASSQGHIKGGRLRPLAIGGEKRLALLPDVPTFTEQGYPGVPANAWFGLFAPAGTPPAIVEKLQREIAAILASPEFKAKEVDAKGYELVASTPAQFAAFLREDSARSARAVKISGAKVE